jgi:hypothetical protein
MALTKVSYSMIDGAVANVIDYGADPTGVADSTAAIQAALDSNIGTVFFPQGTYKTTAPIDLPDFKTLVGVGGYEGSLINGTHAGALFQHAFLRFCTVKDMAFTGAGCTAFLQTSFGANYNENFHVDSCHFYGQLSECIYGNLIFAKITNSTFGFFGTVVSAHRHIVSLGSSTNITNENFVSGNRFYRALGNESVRFDSGTALTFVNNNWESNQALPLRLNGIFNVTVGPNNWFEANTNTTNEIEINVGTHVIDSTPTVISNNQFVPSASITDLVKINNSISKVYFNFNTGLMTGKIVTNNQAKIYSEIGNSFAGYIPPEYLLQETGIFTLTDSSGDGLVFSGGAGNYTRNGNVITFNVSLQYPVTSSVLNAELSGLPYSSTYISTISSADNSTADVVCIIPNSTNKIQPLTVGTLVRRTNAELSNVQLYITGSYFI